MSRVKTAGTYRFVDSLAQGTSRRTTNLQLPLTVGNPFALIKQTYSAWVIHPKTSQKKKWHITAYFAQPDLPELPVPSEDSSLRKITLSSGMVGSSRGKIREPGGEETKDPRRPGNFGPAQISNSYYYASASATSVTPNYDERFPEDQRLIRMLNSQHIM